MRRFPFVRFSALAAASAGLVACGETGEAQSDEAIRQMALDVQPRVERAVGIPFKRSPTIAVRSREQVRQYLIRKLEDEYGPGEFEKVELAYRLFGLLPDTLDLRQLLLSLYTEQVVGYYDPDSSALYMVRGASPENIRLTLMHELVHALQGQYVALDSLLSVEGNNDRRMAAQAAMEGQATLVSVQLMLPEQNVDQLPELWRNYRDAVRRQHKQMPVFSSAPLVIREGLVFPYLAGADFVRWFNRRHRDTVPFGPRLPQSTEQILHPDRYAEGDRPVELAYPHRDDLVYDDNLGEFETRILLQELTGSETVATAAALGWGGDRYAVLRAADDAYALVWWTVWDTEQAAGKFADVLEGNWQERAGRRSVIERTSLDGRAAVKLMDAPRGWREVVPAVSVVSRQ